MGAGVLVAVAACGGSSDDGGEDPVLLECEAKGYPCSLSEVPLDILERSDTLSDEVLAMFEVDRPLAEVVGWLEGQDGMAEVVADDDALRFRLDGGRGTWILRSSLFPSRSTPDVVAHTAVQPQTAALLHVAGPDSDEKKARVLSPFKWDFDEFDDGDDVAATLLATRGYENRVDYTENTSMTDTAVGIASFTDWEDYDVVHVVTHGTRLCDDKEKKEGCRTAIAAGTLQGLAPEGDGVRTVPARIIGLEDRGLEIAKVERGLDIDPDPVPDPEPKPDPKPEPARVTLVMLTSEFFENEYANGLDETFIFINGCKTLGPGRTDLADAVRGSTSVFLGWDDGVSNGAALRAALALYEDLADHGYPAEVAYNRLKSKGFTIDPFLTKRAELHIEGRAGEDDLRIRDVVELLDPGSGELLSASDNIPIVGTQDDGEPDSVPYSIQVDGVTEENARRVTVHLSVGGVEIDPRNLTEGTVGEEGRWRLTGIAPLGFDLEEATTLDFLAWVDLHDGGESDDETPATVVGQEPIMGHEWLMKAESIVRLDTGHTLRSEAELILEFEGGQAFDEPHPRYVVTGGTVTYLADSAEALGCSYVDPGLTFTVTPQMAPSTSRNGAAPSVLIFDTTVAPVQYHGVIYTRGRERVVTQTCPDNDPNDSDTNTVSYGSSVSWMILSPSDPFNVVDRTLIEGAKPHAVGHNLFWTITRTR